MSIEILHADIHMIDLTMRIPFRYGIATMATSPHAFVRVRARIDGREAVGVAADHLPPKWFTKDPDRSPDDEIDEMYRVVEHAVEIARGKRGESAFEVWRQIHDEQTVWGIEEIYPALLRNHGTTLVERALLDAVCRATGKPFYRALRENVFGIDLGSLDERLEGYDPADLLPAEPLRQTLARHTIGMADPLTRGDIPAGEAVDDGLPHAFDECIGRYGLQHFKLKVMCDAELDIERLTRIVRILEERAPVTWRASIDGNEFCRSVAQFRDYWERMTQVPELAPLFSDSESSRLLWVEQPFHRHVALDAEVMAGLRDWEDRPPLIIDESGSSFASLSQALDLGYRGTSHKNCKGVFHGIFDACMIEFLRREDPEHELILSGEDLVNVGPVALLQDCAVAASLGVTSLERNGHHFVAGLSAFPGAVGEQVLSAHPDLYEKSPQGWPTLRIDRGRISLESIVEAPFGTGFELDVEQFTPGADWIQQRKTT